MRRTLVPCVLLSLAVVACTQAPTGGAAAGGGAPDALPLSDLAAASVDVAAARGAMIRFLNAYANAGSDQAKALQAVVEPPALTTWAHWLAVQNASNPGRLTGSADIRYVRYIDLLQASGLIGARLLVDASVTLTYSPPTGPPARRTIDFAGEAIVVERSTGDWAVADVTRNGQSMIQSIHLVQQQEQRQGKVGIAVSSFFTFPPFWEVNVIVINAGPTPIGLDPRDVAIEGSSGKLTPQSHTPSLDLIPAGKAVQGIIDFQTSTDPSGRLVIGLRAKRQTLRFSFSLKALVKSSQGPVGTGASPAPSASPTSTA